MAHGPQFNELLIKKELEHRANLKRAAEEESDADSELERTCETCGNPEHSFTKGCLLRPKGEHGCYENKSVEHILTAHMNTNPGGQGSSSLTAESTKRVHVLSFGLEKDERARTNRKPCWQKRKGFSNMSSDTHDERMWKIGGDANYWRQRTRPTWPH